MLQYLMPVLGFITLLSFASDSKAQAQSYNKSNTVNHITSFEESMLDSVHREQIRSFTETTSKKRRKFELITEPLKVPQSKKYEKYKEVLNIVSRPEGAVATLHKSSGKPIFSCITPCQLKVKDSNLFDIVIYKKGFAPTIEPASVRADKRTKHIFLSGSFRKDLKRRWLSEKAEECSKKTSKYNPQTPSKFYSSLCRPVAPLPSISDENEQCKATFDIAPERWMENIRDVKCTNINLCLRAYQSLNAAIYFPWPFESVEKTIGRKFSINHYVKGPRGTTKELHPCFP